MKKTEHLERIKQKCLANLALAEKRTPGKWIVEDEAEVRTEGGASFVTDCYHGGHYDADFITACAGAAEAGWRATIAAIEVLNPSNPALLGVAFSDDDNKVVAAILAAWPEELL